VSPISRRTFVTETVEGITLLLGASLASPAIARAAAAAASTSTYAPRALTPEQLEQVATIAEHIIPATETPGARAAGVDRFIDTMLAEYYTADERAHFLAGLAAVDARARRLYSRAFLSCGNDDQRALLEQFDRESVAVPPTAAAVAKEASRETERGGGGLAAGSADTSHRADTRRDPAPAFFHMVKELTLLGYYTSQPGATKELRYVQVPGRYDGCVPFPKNGRAWAT
jgi:gluconate 2-dehydrogenase gamma chain